MDSCRSYLPPKLAPIDAIRPAPYNPREITAYQLEALVGSIRRLGMVVPVIVNRHNGMIVAGHQRVRAARELSITEVPCYYVDAVTENDECRFNQIHNSTSFRFRGGGGSLRVSGTGWQGAEALPGVRYSLDAQVVKSCIQLLLRYGNVLSCVATTGGRVVFGEQYCEACAKLGTLCNCFVTEADGDEAARLLGADYGRFSYRALPRSTWVQGLAQMKRLSPDANKKQNRSTLYERYVIPGLVRGERVLDFGAGRCAYAERLSGEGFDVLPVEFYRNDGKRVDVAAGQRDVSRLVASLGSDGLFDKVVCDSVLNSVDSDIAYTDVLATCCSLLRVGGTLYVSGRRRAAAEAHMRAGRSSSVRNFLTYLDGEGFTASFRAGGWFFQKFDDPDETARRLSAMGMRPVRSGHTGESYQLEAVKEAASEGWRESVMREFDLPYPGGRYGRGEEVAEAVARATA